MPISQGERLAILQEASRGWLELVKALRGLSDAEMEQPGVVDGWSVKLLLGHISAWEREAIDAIERAEEGEEPEWPESVDEFNAVQAEIDAGRHVEEIRQQLEETHAEFMSLLETSPAVTRELAYPGYDHVPEHAAQIAAWRARAGAGERQRPPGRPEAAGGPAQPRTRRPRGRHHGRPRGSSGSDG